jgi:hypothetical protein
MKKQETMLEEAISKHDHYVTFRMTMNDMIMVFRTMYVAFVKQTAENAEDIGMHEFNTIDEATTCQRSLEQAIGNWMSHMDYRGNENFYLESRLVTPTIDYELLLRKYIALIAEQEGTTHIRFATDRDFTHTEIDELTRLSNKGYVFSYETGEE